ncbi:MAG: fibronectin type III domain-containing protein [Lachnospiraceae bacterium]|nr:fibronectin type III domain-containing protein [Lachnospiraceae bacterium]
MKSKFTMIVPAMVCLLTIVPFSGGKDVRAAEVTNLVQSGDSESEVSVSWNGILGETKYEVEISEDGNNWVKKTASSNSCKIDHLNSATNYLVRVKGKNQTSYCNPIQVRTACGRVKQVTQTDATTSSVTISWDKVEGANQYNIIKFVDNQEVVIKEVPGTSTTAEIGGYDNKVGFPHSIYVKAVYVMPTGYVAGNRQLSELAPCLKSYDAALVPGKLETPKVVRYYSALKSAWVETTQVEYGSGVEYELYTVNNKKVSSGNLNWGGTKLYYATLGGIDAESFYKVRVRTHSNVGETAKWGEWSDWTYLANGPRKISVKRKKNTVKVSWKKCKGATSYTIFASTKEKSGFKKVGSTKKNSIVIKKIGKKKIKKSKKYYFYVVSNYKKDNVTYKSGNGNTIVSNKK